MSPVVQAVCQATQKHIFKDHHLKNGNSTPTYVAGKRKMSKHIGKKNRNAFHWIWPRCISEQFFKFRLLKLCRFLDQSH